MTVQSMREGLAQEAVAWSLSVALLLLPGDVGLG